LQEAGYSWADGSAKLYLYGSAVPCHAAGSIQVQTINAPIFLIVNIRINGFSACCIGNILVNATNEQYEQITARSGD
jgi:hypothetical protein